MVLWKIIIAHLEQCSLLPPNALRISRAATLDRYSFRAKSAFQNRADLGAA
jgi:hypothetical protein